MNYFLKNKTGLRSESNGLHSTTEPLQHNAEKKEKQSIFFCKYFVKWKTYRRDLEEGFK